MSDCREVKCEDRDTATLPVEQEEIAVVKLFRKQNPAVGSFEIVETWSHRFQTFVEWSILVKVVTTEKSTFTFFHAIEFLDGKDLAFWGQADVKEPQVDSEGNYVLVNPQENVPESKTEEARVQINAKFPEVAKLQARKTMLREFPEARRRFVIVLRHKTSAVRYVVLKDSKETWVQEFETIEDNLETLNSAIESII